MNVAAGIETIPGGHPESGQSHALAGTAGSKAPGAGLAGLLASNSSLPSGAGEEDFRASLQSLLASLGGNAESLEDTAGQGTQSLADTSAAGATGKAKASSAQASAAGQKGIVALPFQLKSNRVEDAAGNSAALKAQIPGLRASIAGDSGNQINSAETGKSKQSSSQTESLEANHRKSTALSATATIPTTTPADMQTTTPAPVPVQAPDPAAVVVPAQTKQPSAGGLSAGLGDNVKGIFEGDQAASDSAGSTLALTGQAPVLGSGAGILHKDSKTPASTANDRTTQSSGAGTRFQSAGTADGASDSSSVGSSSNGSADNTVNAHSRKPETSASGGAESEASIKLQNQGAADYSTLSANLATTTSAAALNPSASEPVRSQASSQFQSKVGFQGSARTAVQNVSTTRSVHTASTLQPIQAESHVAAVVAPSPAADGAPLSREFTVPVGGLNDAAGGGSSTSTPTGIGSRETFAALDADSGAGTQTWIHTGTQHAEAGYHDPILGWIGVRADSGGGGVHASVVPGSAEAAQALGGHLAGLNAYMAEHHTGVESVTMSVPAGRGSESLMDQNAGQSMHQGSGQQNAQEAWQSPQSGGTNLSGQQNGSVGAGSRAAVSGQSEGVVASGQASARGGHISLMA